MIEWIDPRYEELVETMSWAQDSPRPAGEDPVLIRGFVVAEPDEA
jgi:hypothetical protein